MEWREHGLVLRGCSYSLFSFFPPFFSFSLLPLLFPFTLVSFFVFPPISNTIKRFGGSELEQEN